MRTSLRATIFVLLALILLQPSLTVTGVDREPLNDPFDFMKWGPNERNRTLCFDRVATRPCLQEYYRSPDLSGTIRDLVEQKCRDGSESACEDLAALIDDREPLESWSISRSVRYPRPEGMAAYNEAVFGSPKRAADLALRQCEAGMSCGFQLRYFPDHPRLDLIATLTWLSCLFSENHPVGATSCAILGSHRIAREGNVAEAASLWTLDCERGNTTSCLLLGSLHGAYEEHARETYCTNELEPGHVFLGAPALCNRMSEHEAYLAFAKAADDQVAGFLREMPSVDEMNFRRESLRGEALANVSWYWRGQSFFQLGGEPAILEIDVSAFTFDSRMPAYLPLGERPHFHGYGFLFFRNHWQPLGLVEQSSYGSAQSGQPQSLAWETYFPLANIVSVIKTPLPLATVATAQARSPAAADGAFEAPIRWSPQSITEFARRQDEIVRAINVDLEEENRRWQQEGR